MRALGFGQPADGIIQLGYVVADLDAAMTAWSRQLRAGPWYLISDFAGVGPVYRGAPSYAKCDLALGFAGHVQVELIKPRDDHPSVYREMTECRGPGFHHFGVAAVDFDAELASLLAKGHDVAFTACVPSGGRVAYLDPIGDLPGMIELIEMDAALDAMFTAIHRASIDWDGGNIVIAATAGAFTPDTVTPSGAARMDLESPVARAAKRRKTR